MVQRVADILGKVSFDRWVIVRPMWGATSVALYQPRRQVPALQRHYIYSLSISDVNKDWTCKDNDKDFTYSYLQQVAAKPTIAIKQQQWTQSENSQHMTVKP